MQHSDDMSAYVVLAQDLESDACEWQVHTGPDAEERAHAHAERWLKRHATQGRWIAYVRVCGAKPVTSYT